MIYLVHTNSAYYTLQKSEEHLMRNWQPISAFYKEMPRWDSNRRRHVISSPSPMSLRLAARTRITEQLLAFLVAQRLSHYYYAHSVNTVHCGVKLMSRIHGDEHCLRPNECGQLFSSLCPVLLFVSILDGVVLWVEIYFIQMHLRIKNV
ncbi:hypothetical protein CDAR_406201 [Caerostris darwini]|uniref:Uncharacterized protein n=1 Tax=Caerostris darwini TaxID=1538125 RepID=A0AAV4MW95_9ARAC|nr:hypothetical protein CDAR_406201 [Caerostris darwini]